MFKLASLFVDIKADQAPLNSQLEGIKGKLDSMAVAIGTAAGSLAVHAIESAASAITGFFSKGIAGAMDLGESQSKLNAVFGQSGDVITKTADDMAKSFGKSKQSVLDGASAIGLIAKGAGQSKEEAAALGNRMVKLAADAESFYNVPMALALEKIRAGLVGEYEPMRAFGGQLSEEAVTAEALSLGLAKTTKEIDNKAKTAARASLIIKSLADAEGDLERTQDSAKNQARTLAGTIDNLAVSMGTALMPITKEVIGILNDLTSAIISTSSKGESSFNTFVNAVTDGLATLRIQLRNFQDVLTAGLMATFDPMKFFAGGGKEDIVLDILAREMALRAQITDREVASAAAAAKRLALQKESAEIQAKQAEAKKEELKAEQGIQSMAEWIGNQQKIHMEHEAERKRAAKEAAKQPKADPFTSSIMGAADFYFKARSSILSAPDEMAKQQLEVAKKMEAHTKIIAEEVVKPRINVAVLG